MYEEYYGFTQPPFSLTPDPRFLYRSESHDIALQLVWQAIRRKEGFIVLTGDIGTGKTTLCRTVLEQFDPTTFTALVLNPFVSIEDLLRELLLAFGVASRDTLRSGRLATASKHELVRTLHDFLLTLVPIRGSAVVIIDEAQHLSPAVLEEVRILSNLETNEHKLLQIVLVGQLNLLDVLNDARLRQLDQRISIRCLLKPLTREEVDAYVTHRLWVARGSLTVTFTPAAIDLVHAASGGVPRIINLLCDRALMVGCDARTQQITDAHIAVASRALGVTPVTRPSRSTLRLGGRAAALAVVVLLAVLSLGAFALGGNPLEVLQAASNPDVRPLQASSLGVRPLASRPAPDTLPLITVPPFTGELYSVLVDTYTTPRQATNAEELLAQRQLPFYAVDLRYLDGVRRRLLVGRYATRDDAERVRAGLGPAFGNARVVTIGTERLR